MACDVMSEAWSSITTLKYIEASTGCLHSALVCVLESIKIQEPTAATIRMACGLRQGAGNIWTTTHWCGSSKVCVQTPTAQSTNHFQRGRDPPAQYRVCGCVCASAFGLRSHMRQHKETRWAVSSLNRQTTMKEY